MTKEMQNVDKDKSEDDANFNKRQFWSYQRLSSRSTTKKTIDMNKNKQKKHNTIRKQMFHLVNNKVATDKELVKRLDAIYIPPNYKNLVVAKSANNKIQAIGTDKRGRRQYVYNHKFTKKRNDRKYDFIVDLGKKIIQIENDNENALKILAHKPYEKWVLPDDYIPIIIYMLRTYHFRIGNEKYAIENNSYGITTLKKQHIKFDKMHNNKITIEFVGKKGIMNRFTDDKPIPIMTKLLKVLIQNASPDGYLFKYTHDGSKHFITPEHIHSFFQNKYNAEITPKMFRTWYGNYHMLSHLRELYNAGNILKPRMTKTEINSIITQCSEHVSSKLNNTPSVSKQSYIDNKILDLVIKNPYRFASKIPDSSDGQHRFLYKIILQLRHSNQ